MLTPKENEVTEPPIDDVLSEAECERQHPWQASDIMSPENLAPERSDKTLPSRGSRVVQHCRVNVARTKASVRVGDGVLHM